MLEQANVIPTIGVKNVQAAKQFYQNKLGLTPVGESNEDVQHYKAGSGMIEVYKSEYAGTNKATSMTWALGDQFDKTVRELKQKGVQFEHYNMPGTKLEGNVHVMEGEGMKAAWFKDPDGNILCIHDR